MKMDFFALQSIRILARGAELAKAIEPQRSGGHRETLDDASLCPPASLWFKAASPLVAAAPRCGLPQPSQRMAPTPRRVQTGCVWASPQAKCRRGPSPLRPATGRIHAVCDG